MREVRTMGLKVDPDKFALAWRAGYMPAMQKVMSGQLGWTSIDDLHRMICILSAEVFRKYKPDPGTYLGVAQVFDVAAGEVMMVAAHQDDLAHARACGLKTAYIERPREFGPSQAKDVSANPDNTLHAKDLVELADLLDC